MHSKKLRSGSLPLVIGLGLSTAVLAQDQMETETVEPEVDAPQLEVEEVNKKSSKHV